MVSISLGLMEDSAFSVLLPVCALMNTPSMTIIGSLEEWMELTPRMRMVGVEPGWPDAVLIWIPDALPLRASMALVTWVLSISSEPTTAAEPGKADFLAVP